MSNSQNENANCEEEENIFPLFPEVLNDEIPTSDFLVASKRVVEILDQFGRLFAPIKYDMQINIDKLAKLYVADRENRLTLQRMILHEKENNETQNATEALLWLKRGLHMIQSFFEKIIESCDSCRFCIETVPCLKLAYKETLEPYHGWMALQLFSLISRMAPTWAQFLETIRKNSNEKDEQKIIKHMSQFSIFLKRNIINLETFYDENNLDNTSVMPNLVYNV